MEEGSVRDNSAMEQNTQLGMTHVANEWKLKYREKISFFDILSFKEINHMLFQGNPGKKMHKMKCFRSLYKGRLNCDTMN